jgi:hypothetical protein
MVVQLIPLVVSKLGETVQMNTAGSMEAAERQQEIQVRRRAGRWVSGEGWGLQSRKQAGRPAMLMPRPQRPLPWYPTAALLPGCRACCAA